MERGKLLNLAEMKRIYVDKIARVVNAVGHVPSALSGIDLVEKIGKPRIDGKPLPAGSRVTIDWELDTSPWDQETLDRAKGVMDTVEALCRDLGLRVTLRHIHRIQDTLNGGGTNFRKMGIAYDELISRMNDELASCYFLKIDEDKEKHYEAQDLFGPAVAAAYPAAQYDIQEAGSCFACGRWTACVFHLMRALETPLMLLAGSIGVPFGASGNWNKVLDQFDKGLRDALKDNSSKKQDDWRANEEFYSGASALLRNVKNAWRNSVNHAVQSYDEERARGVLNSVESIMKHLATKLREPGDP